MSRFVEDMTTTQLREELHDVREFLKDARAHPYREYGGAGDLASDRERHVRDELHRRGEL